MDSQEEEGASPPDAQAAPGPNQVQVPVPQVPLPLMALAGIVPAGDGQLLVLLTAQNVSGSMTQGYLDGDIAQKLGRQLMELGRECSVRSRLVVPRPPLVSADGAPLRVTQ